MKKAYVKPVMESEAFVANEYVAACYTVRCKECGAYQEGYDSLNEGVTEMDVVGKIYAGNLGGKRGCNEIRIPNTEPDIWKDFWGWLGWQIFIEWLGWPAGSQTTGYYHKVTSVSNWTVTTDHPYASV